MASTQAPNLSTTDTFDKKKQYISARVQIGVPLIDVDFNDSYDMLARAANQVSRGLDVNAPTSANQWELTIRPVTNTGTPATSPGVDPRNSDNVALMLGRMQTRLGLIENRALRESLLFDFVVFDWKKILDAVAELPEDHPYGNYLFLGAITLAGVGDTVQAIDENKLFTVDHFLVGISANVVIPGAAFATMPINETFGPSIDPTEIQYEEPACRIIFTSGANTGEERTLNALINSTTVGWSVALPNPLAQGDTYIIVPGNALTTARTDYDAATVATSAFSGLANQGAILFWLHVFKDDISSEEDSDILVPGLPLEPSHRTQLRWCLRTTRVKYSSAADAGRTFIHPVHYEKLFLSKADGSAELYGGDFYAKGRVEGAGGTLQDGDDLVQTFPSSDGAGAVRHGWDVGAGSDKLTRHHAYTAPVFMDAASVFQITRTALETLLADPENFAISALMVHSSPEKTANAQVLSEYWYPNITVGDIETETPRVVTDPFKTETAPAIGGPVSIFFTPRKRWVDTAALGADAERGRWLSWGRPGWTSTGTGAVSFWGNAFEELSLVEFESSYAAPLLFTSPAHHMGWLDMVSLGMSGLGNAQGRPHPLQSEAAVRDASPPSNRNLFKTAASKNSLFQAGQSSQSFLSLASSLLNPHQELQGSVFPLDVLSGSAQPFTQGGAWIPEWVTGPAQYKLRDGTTVNHFDERGWMFYTDTASDYESSEPVPDFSVRSWEQGLGQAYLFQRGLEFRKLAIKGSYSIQADLFTIDIKAPTIVTEPAEFVAPGQPPGAFPDGGKIANANLAIGFGATAIGAFREGSGFEGDLEFNEGEDKPRQMAQGSYMGLGPNVLEDSNAMRGLGDAPNQADLIPFGGGGANAVERWNYNHDDETHDPGENAGQIDGRTKISKEFGAWGRFNITEDPLNGGLVDTPEMLDQWQNRCTAMRLRYHIGDYYPGPNDDKGIPTNALVDTLMLYVRAEPLPLVHWMTLPRHQHSIIEGSLSYGDMFDRMLAASWHTGVADVSGFWDGSQAIISTDSPAKGDLRFDPDNQIGDDDPLNMPFQYRKQPFVNWYHPLQEYLKTPHPFGSSNIYPSGGEDTIAYRKFGERSLIVPALTTTDQNIAVHDTVFPVTSENFSQDPGANSVGQGHWNLPETPSTSSRATTIGVGSVTQQSDDLEFPFTQQAATLPGSQGATGPVFIAASRTFAQEVTGDVQFYGVGKIFDAAGNQDTWGTAEQQLEYDDFPQVDESGYSDDNVAMPSMPTWGFPVLRSALRSDTVAAIYSLFVLDEQISFVDATASTLDVIADEVAGVTELVPLTGPDFTTDTVFIGDTGTALMIDPASLSGERSFFQNALALGIPARISSGRPTHLADTRNVGEIVHDLFELAVYERAEGLLGPDTVAFLPLINTFLALEQQGLQQKLLWNSSLRILHARPGGGFRPGASSPTKSASSQPRSLTELFIVRNRETGAIVTMPGAPLLPADKPYLHFESIHPAAAGTGPYSPHPNNAKLGHLYKMISDTTGGPSASAGGSSDPLYDEAANPDHEYGAAEYLLQQFKSGAAGDCFVGDPFDYEYSKRNADNLALVSQAPKRDRLNMNCGLEIDLVTEMRYVRENAAAHNLDAAGINGLTYIDMMPSVGELTAPGDHEIIFVLYTCSYGHKFVDNTVPDGYNPSVAGCHLHAEIHINRPNERISSDDGGDGEHYGEARETYHVLGHQ